jgi:prevent-host-death family protein
MTTVSIFEAKTNLSKYVSAVFDKEEPFIVILRNGKPVAKLVPIDDPAEKRIGIAKGAIPVMPSLETFNDFDLVSEFENNGGLL